jgi:hypothetical protein
MTRHSRRCVMTSPRPALRLTTGRVGGAYHEGVMELGSEDRDLVHLDASSTPKTEADAYTAPLIQKIGAPSIAQIEKLIGELQEAKNLLESEGERIQREMVRYIKFAQLASLGHVTFNRLVEATRGTCDWLPQRWVGRSPFAPAFRQGIA